MSTISAKDVKQLRDQTGAGMMDCKKALIESNGDIEKAIEYLRKRGQKLSDKRADRETKEGVVLAVVSDDNSKGVTIKLSCETDFVAKNEEFINLTEKFASIALANFPDSLEALLALPYEETTIGEKVVQQTGVIGEKINLAEYAKLEAPMVTSYIHMGNKAAVLVGLSKASDSFVGPGRDVAMQIAAMHPIAVDKNGVDQAIIDKEFEIGKEIAIKEGKPEAMIEKIATGKLNRYFKDNTLLAQAFVKDNKKNVGDYLKSIDADLTVNAFRHVKLG